ncbi:MAG: DNA gyrase subunit B [Clostridiales bacterium]|nr:DNA gyrase subunit B [Clostridiales bacterium]
MVASYDSKDLIVLEGLDAVRMRPGMYIGTTGVKGLHHLLWEIIDNAVDEVANGFGNKVEVTLHKDGTASVFDNGRGIPVSPHPKLKISGVEVVFTQLHAGGKFGDNNYKYSGGLHGVGASVTNALSRFLEVTIYKDGKKYFARFESVEKNGKIHSGVPVEKLKEVGNTTLKGTYVKFLPDDRVFKDTKFDYNTVLERLKETAFLNKGIHIELIDERTNARESLCYEGGIRDYVTFLTMDKKPLFVPPIYIENEIEDTYVSLALQYVDNYTDNIFSFVNNIPTPEGGTHEVGFKIALTKVLNDFAKKHGLIKDKDPAFIGDDFREGMVAVLSIKMKNVQFEGQTKTKLGNVEARARVENVCNQGLTEFFASKKNENIGNIIIEKAKGAARVRQAAKRAKDLARSKNSIESTMLIGKLASCTSRNPDINEVFIVEGDSAGGTAKQGRDRYYQAILPLRGKPLNSEKKRIDQVLANEEIRTIIGAIGTGIGEDFKLENLKYNKIIILSDADQDGMHIRCILLTFFFRYMRPLITNGNIYVGMPPLYKVTAKDKEWYCYTDEELENITKNLKNYNLQRYKGLGEMSAEQLWTTTMDPARRSMIRVSVEDAVQADKEISMWMGDDVGPRKDFINRYANFNKVDSFEKNKEDKDE